MTSDQSRSPNVRSIIGDPSSSQMNRDPKQIQKPPQRISPWPTKLQARARTQQGPTVIIHTRRRHDWRLEIISCNDQDVAAGRDSPTWRWRRSILRMTTKSPVHFVSQTPTYRGAWPVTGRRRAMDRWRNWGKTSFCEDERATVHPHDCPLCSILLGRFHARGRGLEKARPERGGQDSKTSKAASNRGRGRERKRKREIHTYTHLNDDCLKGQRARRRTTCKAEQIRIPTGERAVQP